MRKYFNWFWQYWKRAPLRMTGVVLLTVVTIGLKTGFPVLLKTIVDQLTGDYSPDDLTSLVLIFAGIAILHELASVFLPTYRHYMNTLFAARIRNRYYGIFTRKRQSFFQKYKTGDLLTRLTDDIDGSWDRILWYSCSGLLRPFEAILILVMTLAVMFTFSWKLTLFTFIPLPFLVWVMATFEHRLTTYTEMKQKVISDCNNVLESCFTGIRVVKTTRSEKDQLRKYKDVLTQRVDREKDFLKINQLVHLFAILVNDFGTIIVIFVGSLLLIQDQITLGTFVLFITYLGRLIEPIWTLAFFYASSKQVFRYVDRLQETEDKALDRPESGQQNIGSQFTDLEFRGVTYQFDGNSDRNILKDASFQIQSGEHMAIVGPVGSGKTTLLEMIMGNLQPLSGGIFVNGKPMEEIQSEQLTAMLGYVNQESVLFSETISKNLTLGNRYDSDEIDIALEHSLMTAELKRFPKGLSTVLGRRGITISGGQKQRLSIARTLLRKPSILLLDDCTAAMDAATESRFWKILQEQYPETTIIMVTHRRASARKFRKIFHLDNGILSQVQSDEQLAQILP